MGSYKIKKIKGCLNIKNIKNLIKFWNYQPHKLSIEKTVIYKNFQ